MKQSEMLNYSVIVGWVIIRNVELLCYSRLGNNRKCCTSSIAPHSHIGLSAIPTLLDGILSICMYEGCLLSM